METKENSEEKLTPEQIKNWRQVLVGMIGPYAMIMPDEMVQKLRDKMQKEVNEMEIKNDNIKSNNK